MGYVFDFKTAVQYDQGFSHPGHYQESELEEYVIKRLLRPVSGQRLLDIGCGTGRLFPFFLKQGFCVTGIDPSVYMLDFAKPRAGEKVDLHRGFGEHLPFDTNTFDVATVIQTLEFADNPKKLLAEACRVAKDKVFVGCLNRFSPSNARKRVAGIHSESYLRHARLFSVWQLKNMVQKTAGNVPVFWRTTSNLPGVNNKHTKRLEYSNLVQHSPCGAYVAMVICLSPGLAGIHRPAICHTKPIPKPLTG